MAVQQWLCRLHIKGIEFALLPCVGLYADLHICRDTAGPYLWLHDRAWCEHTAQADQRANDLYLPFTHDRDPLDWGIDLVLDD